MARQFEFTLSYEAVVEAMKVHYRHDYCRPKMLLRNVYIWVLCVSLIGLAPGMILGVANFDHWNLDLVKLAGLYAVILLLNWLLNYYIYIPYRAQNFAKGHKLVGVRQNWVWDDRNLLIRTPKLKSVFVIRLFARWQDYNRFFLLYISKERFYIIPKFSLDHAELEAFQALLAKQKGPYKR